MRKKMSRRVCLAFAFRVFLVWRKKCSKSKEWLWLGTWNNNIFLFGGLEFFYFSCSFASVIFTPCSTKLIFQVYHDDVRRSDRRKNDYSKCLIYSLACTHHHTSYSWNELQKNSVALTRNWVFFNKNLVSKWRFEVRETDVTVHRYFFLIL